MEMKQEKLDKIIADHKHWSFEDCEGWQDMKADLRGANLVGACLVGADLEMADLGGANLRWADLRGANLEDAFLEGTCLEEADLRGADLGGAYMEGANLRGADLRGACLKWTCLEMADLGGANLRGAELRRANLERVCLEFTNLIGADLRGACLRRANMEGACLRGANLEGANMKWVKNISIPYSCPDFGMFVGWKKASGKIICLEIPEDAKRLSATGRKCRCDKAKVLQIQNLDGTQADVESVASYYDQDFIYKVGETVTVEDFDDDRWNECSTGIHFFINRQEAVNYGE